MISLFLGYKS